MSLFHQAFKAAWRIRFLSYNPEGPPCCGNTRFGFWGLELGKPSVAGGRSFSAVAGSSDQCLEHHMAKNLLREQCRGQTAQGGYNTLPRAGAGAGLAPFVLSKYLVSNHSTLEVVFLITPSSRDPLQLSASSRRAGKTRKPGAARGERHSGGLRVAVGGGPSAGTKESLGRDMSTDAGRDAIRSRQGCDCRKGCGRDADSSSPSGLPLCPTTFLHPSPRAPPAPHSPISAVRPPQPRYHHAASPSPRCSRSSGAKSPGSCGGGRTLSLSGSCRVGGSWTGRALIDYTEDLGSLTAARAALAGGEASPAC